jgi:hypothetical protein
MKSQFERMKELFAEMGLEFRTTETESNKFIDVLDSEGNKAEFTFDADGNFSKSGYYAD